MKVQPYTVVPLCCDEGKKNIIGTFGYEFSNETIWEIGKDENARWESIEKCPFCKAELPKNIVEYEINE